MAGVNIILSNGQLGLIQQTNDGICGIVCSGDIDGYTLGVPLLLTSLGNALAEGITLASSPFLYKQVKEFYDEAGTGALLYVLPVPNTMTVADICDHTNTDGAKKLLDFAGGKIKLLGVISNDAEVYGQAVVPTEGINPDVYTAVDNMALLAQDYFSGEQPFRAIIGGTSYDGNAASLASLITGTTNNRTAILLGDTETGTGAAIGLALGRLSAVPVQRKISRVRTGAMSNAAAWLGASTIEAAPGNAGVIAGKGFITWATYPNVSGYFFSGDDTCSAVTDDYHYLARGRVIDKAHILAYTTFVQEVDDEVLVNADGTLDAGFCTWLSQQIVNQINGTMTANKEISGVACTIDPKQNILETNQLNVVLKITPVGYATDIEISLGFNNPANG